MNDVYKYIQELEFAQNQSIQRAREDAIQLALSEVEAPKKGCITVAGLVAVLMGETAQAAGHAMSAANNDATARQKTAKAHTTFIKAQTSWRAWLRESVKDRALLVREVATLGPANATPAVRQWAETNTADLPGYVAALVVLKADARRWLEGLGIPLPPSLRDTGEATQQQPAPANTTPRPVQRQRAQELAILQAIQLAGHDPKRLLKNEPGKPGIKAQVSDALKGDSIFTGPTVFNKAWDRLRRIGDIADAA